MLPLTVPDLVCVDDLDLFASETLSDLENLEQDVYHLLIESLGSNPDDPTRGIGIEDLLSSSDVQVNAMAFSIDTQLRDDDRIHESHTTVTETKNENGPSSFDIDIQIEVDSGVVGLKFAFDAVRGLTSSQ
jgi:hypothetical protein